MVVRWRAEFGFAEPKERPLLVAARVVDPPQRGSPKGNAPFILHDLLVSPPNSITVELADGRPVFAPAGSDPGRCTLGDALLAHRDVQAQRHGAYAYLKDVLERVVDGYPANRLGELLPWAWKASHNVDDEG